MEASERDDFCFWTFIEKYYPKYYSCGDILLSDILSRKLDCEEICEEDEEMIKDWDVRVELLELEINIFSKALKNYFKIMDPYNPFPSSTPQFLSFIFPMFY
nr:hypothetical protein [Flavobacterium sp.]